MFKSIVIILLFFLYQFGQAQIVEGRVLDDKTGLGLPFAKVYCIEMQNGTVADSSGYWQLDNAVVHQMTLQISANEFESKLLTVEDYTDEIIVKLEHAHIHLDEVIVSTPASKLQRYNTSPVDARDLADLNKIEQSTLVDALSNMPGIYNLSTGNGISKPVIRGLSGMRILKLQPKKLGELPNG